MPRLSLSPDEFRALAHAVSDLAAEYLETISAIPTFPNGLTGSDTERVFDTELPLEGIGSASFESLRDIIRMSRPNSPRFFGYVFGSGLPVGALGDFAASVLNQNVTAWRSAPAAATIEKTVVRWLAEAIGCPGFQGNLTNGGSSANLMALCMAREAKSPANELGNQGGIIYCSDEAHMSDPESCEVAGLGAGRSQANSR